MHRLLKRQLKKAGLDQQILVHIGPLLEQIDEAYQASDNDLYHIENVLEKSSQELFQANEQLKNNVEIISSRLAKVAGNIQEVIFEIDLSGNWSYLNPAWEKLTGVKVEDCLGKHYSKYLMDHLGEPLEDLIDFTDPNYNTSTKIVECLTPDGALKWFDFSLKGIKSGDGILEGYIGTVVDISDLKETELALISAKEKETRANAAKDDFLSTMSHEIRTPLNAVIGVSHLLLLEDPKKEQLENLNALKYSSEHLLELVNDILDFNKIASGSLELEDRDFSLEHILNGIGSIFNIKAREKNLKFKIKKDSSLPDMFMGDSTRIAQVITNLVNNAIKFTEKGKVILDIELTDELQDEYLLEFKVIDTGIGIPHDKKDKIFHSFAQANSDTTRKYGGTGLGLAICKKLLEIMGSDLFVESEVGKGSEFSFFLRLKKSEKISGQDTELDLDQLDYQKKDNLKGVKILVAEDNKLNVLVIKKFLSKWNVNFDIAENGLIALDKALNNSYDMILMDLQMPVMNGFDASKAIRETNIPLNKVIPIYALSASTGIDIKHKILKFGMNGLITKPFNPSKLYRTLSKIILNAYVS
ncbi:MAG: ATP-binding protein [Bacteroidota bacterium]